MKITYKGDYALKALFQLAINYSEDKVGVMSISDIARSGDMPEKFLEQILLNLRRGGFVKSKRGVNGGFLLARPPKDITVGAVVKFVEGPIEPISCVETGQYRGCKDLANCIFRDVWKEAHKATSAIVDALTFGELITRYNNKGSRASCEYII